MIKLAKIYAASLSSDVRKAYVLSKRDSPLKNYASILNLLHQSNPLNARRILNKDACQPEIYSLAALQMMDLKKILLTTAALASIRPLNTTLEYNVLMPLQYANKMSNALMENALSYFQKTKTEIEKPVLKVLIVGQYNCVWLPNAFIVKNYYYNLQKTRPDTNDCIFIIPIHQTI